MRPIHLFAATLLIATLFADGGTAQQSEHLRFAFVTHGGPGNPFWNVVITGMEDAGKRYDVDVQWLSNPTFSIENMADFLDDAIAADVDGLAVTCPDPDAIRENVARARAAGIPVVLNTADPGAGTEQALPTLFYIGASEFLGARRMHARSWQLLQRRASRHASQVFTAFSNRRVSSSMV